MKNEIIIRNWRITRGIPAGSHVWFDPKCEGVKLYRIPPRDGVVVSEDPGDLAEEGDSGHLDKVVSVSASGLGLAMGDSDRFEQVELLEEELDLPF